MTDTVPTSQDAPADILVAGAGVVGLTAAIAFARRGWTVVAIGAPGEPLPGRTVALLDGSVRLYRALDLWSGLAPDAAPLLAMRIVDDTGSLFRPPPATFRAEEIGLDAFGHNIETEVLARQLAAVANAEPRLRVVEGRIAAFTFGPQTVEVRVDGGRAFAARLGVGADGRRSAARASARIGVRESSYRQAALTTLLAHDLPHRGISTEFHTRGGPFTLVPLAASPAAPHRSSLVWMMPPDEAQRRRTMSDAALALEVERQAHSFLGRMGIDGPRGLFPIASMTAARFTAPRLALVGEAAHALPPIGAQGLNLGLRDVAHLDEILAAGPGADPGSPEVLARYEAARRGDVGSRRLGVDTLNRMLLADLLPADFLRGAGLLALSAVGPLRRAVMRAGVMPGGTAPAMMRPAPDIHARS